MKIKYLKNITILVIAVIIATCIISCNDESESPVLSMTSFQVYIDDDGYQRYVLDSVSCGIQGRIYVDGGTPITSRGVCWKLKANDGDTIPSLDNLTKEADLGAGTGLLEVEVDGLTPDTIYHMRTYAVNADGLIGYGWVLRVSTYQSLLNTKNL